jgi:hypothetical protein
MCRAGRGASAHYRFARASTVALFLAGMFAGGAIDHLILVMKREARSPYGLKVGVVGNGLLALLDAAVAVAAYAAHRRSGRAHRSIR